MCAIMKLVVVSLLLLSATLSNAKGLESWEKKFDEFEGKTTYSFVGKLGINCGEFNS